MVVKNGITAFSVEIRKDKGMRISRIKHMLRESGKYRRLGQVG
jgi:hypothetical protein